MSPDAFLPFLEIEPLPAVFIISLVEAHFVGTHDKAPILAALGAHIFFDDQEKHILGAASVVPAAHVPGPHDPRQPVIPASA
jgi:hypothetical protein